MPAKFSRAISEPEPINLGLQLTFVQDTSVHLNCVHCVFLQKLLCSGLFCFGFGFGFGLLFFFFKLSRFLIAPDNKPLIRRKSNFLKILQVRKRAGNENFPV